MRAVAVIGLGIMGSGMARNLLAAGFDVAVYNRSRDKAEALGREGARVAATPGEAAEGAEVVVSMVADDAASREVWLGEGGALAAAREGAVLVESSTLTVEWVRELAEAAAGRGLELLDAPVTGSRDQAAEGKLLFLVGGSTATLERARPVLAAMSRDMVHLGPTGSGAMLKLINNFLCGVQASSLAEALGLLERAGLDRDQALGVLMAGAPASPIVKGLAGRMVEKEYTPPYFALRLMSKDLRYAVEEGARLGVELRTGVAAREVMERAVREGFGEQDMSAVVEPFRKGGRP